MVSLTNNICNELVSTKGLIIFTIILLIKVTIIGCTNTSTVCYGPAGDPCLTHELSCPSPLVVRIINTSYGYRSGCNNLIGLTQCSNTTCCNEEPGDCFIQFTSDEHQQVLGNCSGVETCTLFGFREISGRECGGTISAYSKIQYDCVTKDSIIMTSTLPTYSQTTSTELTVTSLRTSVQSSSIQPTFQSSNTIPLNRSIVGGIFGAIIIIVITVVVIVFLYKRQKRSPTPPSTDNKMKIRTVSPNYHVINGPGTINNRKDTSGYDEIELDNKPQVQATAAHLNSSTNSNRNGGMEREPKTQITDNYDHVVDDKLKIKSLKDLDNYNHIGTHDHSVHEDNYNHIGNNPSLNSNHFELDYNHINRVFDTFNDEDDYNHIGNNDNNNVITDDNYHHIGSGDVKVEGDYDHIEPVSNNNHFHEDNNQAFGGSPYNLATC